MTQSLTEENLGTNTVDPRHSSVKDAASFLRNGLMLSLSSLVVSAIGLIYRIYLARYLGPGTYGLYIFITTFIGYFGIISMFGFRSVVVRQIAANRAHVPGYARTGVEMRILSGAVALLLSVVFILFLHRTVGHRPLFLLYAITLPIAAVTDILDAVFLGLESSEYSTISALISSAVKIGVGIWLLVNHYSLFAILLLFIVVSILNLLIDWILLRYRLGIRLKVDEAEAPGLRRYLFKEALPFWYISLISKVYYKNDILVLGFFKGDTVVGWYGGAYMAIDVLLMFAGALANSMFPIISRTYSSDRQRSVRYFELACKYVMLLLFPVCFLVAIFGPRLIPLVLGKSFVKGLDALTVLIWMVFFETIAFLAGTMLSAMGQQKQMAKVGALVSVANLLTTLALVPHFSYMGAAWATTVTSVLNFGSSLWVVKRCLPDVQIVKAMAGVVVCGIVMGSAMLLIGCLNYIIGAACGLALYAFILFAFKVVRPEDIEKLRVLLRMRKQGGVANV